MIRFFIFSFFCFFAVSGSEQTHATPAEVKSFIENQNQDRELMSQSTDSTKPIFEDVDDEKLKRAKFIEQQAQRNNPVFKAQQIEQKLQHYLNTTRILQLYPQTKKTLESALRDQIQKLGNKWPEDNLKIQEQIFWNVIYDDDDLNFYKNSIKNIFSSSIVFKRKEFKNFYNPYLQRLEETEKPELMDKLLTIYQAFPETAERTKFINFCNPYLQGVLEFRQPRVMIELLPIYQAFPDLTQRNAFIEFCNPNLQGFPEEEKPELMDKLLTIYQTFPETAQRTQFINFCNPYLQGVLEFRQPRVMIELLPIYQAFPDLTQRDRFIEFCNPYLQRLLEKEKPSRMNKLLPIYQAFPDATQRNQFINFCNANLQGVPESEKPEAMYSLSTIYQAFSDQTQRNEFISFCTPFLQELKPAAKPRVMEELLPIYQAFSDQTQRNEFISFCTPHWQWVPGYYKPRVMNNLLPIYQAFPDQAQRNEFINFYDPYLQGLETFQKQKQVTMLLPIYKFYRKDFEKFIVRHPNNRVIATIITSYANRCYLRHERVRAALQAEGNPANRQQPMYNETGLSNQLPAFYTQDLLLAQARGAVANAHEFDAIYEQEYTGLQGWCSDNGYVERQGATPRTIYNGENSLRNYTTNAEVEDFIAYLDALPQSEQGNVSIIKQMLGLEAKAGNTTGGFAPYLGHSMYYAKPSPPAPRGDEMLAKVWFMMKEIGERKPDAEDYKKSVMLAILEAAEIQNGRVDTHCQTRITGELMKCIAWHLPGSRLRPLIAAKDVPPARDVDDIKARITFAPDKAKQLFNKLHALSEGNSRKVWEEAEKKDANPELWQIYTAYYDDLYRRRKNPDGTYAVDENILTRDEHGNLAKRHRADGTLREPGEVEIVYYQSEFQVLEQAFTECMRQEFEEQRGLIY